jgi:hypothetical protein
MPSRTRMRRPSASARTIAAAICLLLAFGIAGPAAAEFPYPAPPESQDPYAYGDYMRIGPGEWPPSDIHQDKKEYWEYSSKSACEIYAAPEPPLDPGHPKWRNCSPTTRLQPQEHFGVTGASVDRAWETTTGRPDVVIAIHDSGVTWTNLGKPMWGQNNKTWLNRGELPIPDWGTGHALDPYDRNSDGIFNIKDYCPGWEDESDCGGTGDSRVRGAAASADTDFNANGIIDPEDLIFLFSDGEDTDGNGYDDDFVGWDTYEDDNNPYDEVQYGHGSGEANDSTGEVANNKEGDKGSCPNCMSMHMRVGNSFIADVNDFAEGVIYAADNGASVIQSALGTLNNSRFAQEAIDYAYRRGVVLIASAADESAGHHNQPSALEHAVTMNSVGEPQDFAGEPPMQPPTYLEFRGCTNWGAYVTAAVPSNSCSSEAVGRSAGMAGLAYAAARNAVAAGTLKDYGILDGAKGVAEGHALSAEELDQLIATTADDVNFTQPDWTDRTLPESQRYPGTPGWDPFFGYGRINARRIVEAITADKIPPEADITSPKWFDIVSPSAGAIQIAGRVASLRTPKYSYEVLWAPWTWKGPSRESYPPALFTNEGVTLPEGAGADQSSPREGVLATIDPEVVKERLDLLNAGKGTEGPGINPATGRGENENEHHPDKFGVIVRLVVTAKDEAGEVITTSYDSPDGGGDPNLDPGPVGAPSEGPVPLIGLGTKNFFLHEDPKLFPGYFKNLEGDGAAPPRFADLDDDGDHELIVATSNGEIHAYKHDGGELDGWPVYSSDAQLNYRAPAYQPGSPGQPGEITVPVHAAVLRSPAVGDLDRDGDLEVAVADFMGRLSVFDHAGRPLPNFPVRTDPVWSSPQREDRENGFYNAHPELVPGDYQGSDQDPGDPDLDLPNHPDLVPDLVNRRGKVGTPYKQQGDSERNPNRTHWAFLAAPTFSNLDQDDQLEILAGAADRHLYAWNLDGTPVPGWPVFLRDPAKLDEGDLVDPVTRLVLDDERDDRHMAGYMVNSPAVGDLDGDDDVEIVATVNEGYDEDLNSNDQIIELVRQAYDGFGNQRVYAIHDDGAAHGGGAPSGGNHPHPNAYLPGWPARLASVLGLLPVVGEGPDGSPVLGNVDGGDELETGIFGTAGPAYIFKPNGESMYGRDDERDVALRLDGMGASSNSVDKPASIPALGGAIFSRLGSEDLSLAVPAAGIGKLLDVVLPEDQLVSDNHLSVWELQSGDRSQHEAFPREVNDLQFLATPASADIDGDGSEEVLEGSAYSDLHAFSAVGEEPGARTLDPAGWPKFTGGWTVGPPAVGDFNGDGQRDIAHVIREGRLFAWHGNGADVCDPATWPEFGHDNWNTNNEEVDATRPAAIDDLDASPGVGGSVSLTWSAPGDDGPCGRAHSYEIRRSDQPITSDNFDEAELVGTGPAGDPGTAEEYEASQECGTNYYAVRTWDADPDRDTQAHPANPSAASNNASSTRPCPTGGETTPPIVAPPPPGDPGGGGQPAPGPTSPGSVSPSASPTATETAPPPRGTASTTLSSDRDRVDHRRPFTLAGVVTGTPPCLGPYEIAVHKRVHGGTSIEVLGRSVSTDLDGSWRLTLRSKRSADYIAEVVPSGNCDGGRSLAVSVGVRVGIEVTDIDSPSRLERPSRFRVRGVVRPEHPGTRVHLERRRDGRWRSLDVDRLDRRSRFTLVGSGERGRFRIVWRQQDPDNLRSHKFFRR